ncbi:MAG: polysaccharide deacetylase family protein [Solirubrobacterales bacterium]
MTAPALLERQLVHLRRRGYRLLAADQLVDRSGAGRPPNRTAVVTFDDGWLDGLTVAAPLLNRLGVRGTFFVCPGLLGQRFGLVDGPAGQLLTKDQVAELADAGMEIGAHSMTHPDLRLIDDDQLAWELGEGKRRIEEITAKPCRTLAYPFGFHDRRVRAAAEQIGFELAFAWSPGPWKRYAMPRLPAPPRHGARRLALKMLGVRRRG